MLENSAIPALLFDDEILFSSDSDIFVNISIDADLTSTRDSTNSSNLPLFCKEYNDEDFQNEESHFLSEKADTLYSIQEEALKRPIDNEESLFEVEEESLEERDHKPCEHSDTEIIDFINNILQDVYYEEHLKSTKLKTAQKRDNVNRFKKSGQSMVNETGPDGTQRLDGTSRKRSFTPEFVETDQTKIFPETNAVAEATSIPNANLVLEEEYDERIQRKMSDSFRCIGQHALAELGLIGLSKPNDVDLSMEEDIFNAKHSSSSIYRLIEVIDKNEDQESLAIKDFSNEMKPKAAISSSVSDSRTPLDSGSHKDKTPTDTDYSKEQDILHSSGLQESKESKETNDESVANQIAAQIIDGIEKGNMKYSGKAIESKEAIQVASVDAAIILSNNDLMQKTDISGDIEQADIIGIATLNGAEFAKINCIDDDDAVSISIEVESLSTDSMATTQGDLYNEFKELYNIELRKTKALEKSLRELKLRTKTESEQLITHFFFTKQIIEDVNEALDCLQKQRLSEVVSNNPVLQKWKSWENPNLYRINSMNTNRSPIYTKKYFGEIKDGSNSNNMSHLAILAPNLDSKDAFAWLREYCPAEDSFLNLEKFVSENEMDSTCKISAAIISFEYNTVMTLKKPLSDGARIVVKQIPGRSWPDDESTIYNDRKVLPTTQINGEDIHGSLSDEHNTQVEKNEQCMEFDNCNKFNNSNNNMYMPYERNFDYDEPFCESEANDTGNDEVSKIGHDGFVNSQYTSGHTTQSNLLASETGRDLFTENDLSLEVSVNIFSNTEYSSILDYDFVGWPIPASHETGEHELIETADGDSRDRQFDGKHTKEIGKTDNMFSSIDLIKDTINSSKVADGVSKIWRQLQLLFR